MITEQHRLAHSKVAEAVTNETQRHHTANPDFTYSDYRTAIRYHLRCADAAHTERNQDAVIAAVLAIAAACTRIRRGKKPNTQEIHDQSSALSQCGVTSLGYFLTVMSRYTPKSAEGLQHVAWQCLVYHEIQRVRMPNSDPQTATSDYRESNLRPDDAVAAAASVPKPVVAVARTTAGLPDDAKASIAARVILAIRAACADYFWLLPIDETKRSVDALVDKLTREELQPRQTVYALIRTNDAGEQNEQIEALFATDTLAEARLARLDARCAFRIEPVVVS